MTNDLVSLKNRPEESHKGTYGKLLLICGSVGMAGAGVLAARSALRTGAGLVMLCIPKSTYPVAGAQLSCPLVVPCPETEKGTFSPDAYKQIKPHLERADAIVIGPGIGQNDQTEVFLKNLLQQHSIPTVLDADAINILSEDPDLLSSLKNTVITPHPGEFSRITDDSIAEIQQNRKNKAFQWASKNEPVLVLKGHNTVVSHSKQEWVNSTGNSGMATGGTGDVLSGIIGTFVGQKYDLYEAAKLGVYLHGYSGDLAAEQLGKDSVIASDLISHLPSAIQQYRG